MSSKITTMPQSIVDWLKEIPELKHITFMTEYPPQAKAVPLRNSIVSVGLQEVQITDRFYESEEGELVRDEYCRNADIHIILGIHVPDSLGGSTCHDVFAKIVNFLTFSSDLNIVSSTCGHVISDRNTESLVMEAILNIGAEFCPAEETGLYFNSFADKTFFCKSHTDDTSLHLVEGEREKWSDPCVFGTYNGNGSSSVTVNLGFSPRFVVVFIAGGGVVGIDFEEQVGKMYFAYATRTTDSIGAQCTSNGFRAYQGTARMVGNVYPALNELGFTYTYYAVK